MWIAIMSSPVVQLPNFPSAFTPQALMTRFVVTLSVELETEGFKRFKFFCFINKKILIFNTILCNRQKSGNVRIRSPGYILLRNIQKLIVRLNIVAFRQSPVGTPFFCKKIESLKDLKNLHIRAPANKPVIETLTALGCDVEPADFNKVFEGLQSGRFEAQENPIPAISCHKLNLVQKYLAVTNHSFDAMPLVIRKDVWDSLSDEDRQIIQEAANNAEKLDHNLVKAKTLLLITDLKKQGMTITYPDLEEFKKACSCIYEQYNQAFGKSFMSLALKLAQQ